MTSLLFWPVGSQGVFSSEAPGIRGALFYPPATAKSEVSYDAPMALAQPHRRGRVDAVDIDRFNNEPINTVERVGTEEQFPSSFFRQVIVDIRWANELGHRVMDRDFHVMLCPRHSADHTSFH